jgi:hypothetical protein
VTIRLGGRTAVIATLVVAMAWLALPDHPAGAQSSQGARTLSAGDDALLEDLSKRSFMFFWEHADPATGKVGGFGPPADAVFRVRLQRHFEIQSGSNEPHRNCKHIFIFPFFYF